MTRVPAGRLHRIAWLWLLLSRHRTRRWPPPSPLIISHLLLARSRWVRALLFVRADFWVGEFSAGHCDCNQVFAPVRLRLDNHSRRAGLASFWSVGSVAFFNERHPHTMTG